MALINRNAWKGHDNTFKLRLESADPDTMTAPADLSLVTSMELELRSVGDAVTTITSNAGDAPPTIDWWAGILEQGEVIFDLGQWLLDNDVAQGQYDCRLTVFSPTTSSGLVWLSWINDDLSLNVLD
ncbi:MAG: hypothetical protein OEU86_06240 [Gammaproteobacteria bacterium]|nr:hypothetical protein [Gammaproteobacteria bacterium]